MRKVSTEIGKAVDLAVRYGQIPGEHHKRWVIDQMLRLLLNDEDYYYLIKELDEDDEYEKWDVGIAP